MTSIQEEGHVPVLLNEMIFYLNPGPDENFIDCTIGLGGHSEAILKKTSPQGRLLGIDWDKEAIEASSTRLKKYAARLKLMNDNFARLEEIVSQTGLQRIKGILIDLGVSSVQLKGKFSFKSEQRLDLRFVSQNEVDAYQIINYWPPDEIVKILKDFGEERFARRIVKEIVSQREQKPIVRAVELAELVGRVIPKKYWPPRIHPATRTFQALRIAVNQELDNLKAVLPQAIKLLHKGGRLAVISFHSLEDRIVKQFFKQQSKDCVCPPRFPTCRCDHQASVWLVTKKAVSPTQEEISQNPRARSAKLRVVEKI